MMQFTMEHIARSGSVAFAHDRSRCLHDSNAFEVTVKDERGDLLIGTYVHDDEMNELVGPVMADRLRESVSRGTYITKLNPVEVLGLRGTLVERIEAGDWSHTSSKGECHG